MKKIFALLLALTLALSLPACGSKTNNDDNTLDQSQQQRDDEDDNDGSTPDQSRGQEDNEDGIDGSTSEQSQQQGEDESDNSGSTSGQPQQQKPNGGDNSGTTPSQPQQQEPDEGDKGGSTPGLPPQQEPNGDNNSDSIPDQSQQQESPDLNKFYEDFMASLGDSAPGMIDLSDEVFLNQFYPGLTGYEKKQAVVQGAAISMVAFEFALVELENAADVQAVSEILQARIDTQIEGGAFYPMTIEKWENARIVTHGNVAALICAGDQQAQAEEAFNALFR